MKLKNILILLLITMSQAAFSTGSDGGNSGQTPTKDEDTQTICVFNANTNQQVCVVVTN
jgi:hypothetical protein